MPLGSGGFGGTGITGTDGTGYFETSGVTITPVPGGSDTKTTGMPQVINERSGVSVSPSPGNSETLVSPGSSWNEKTGVSITPVPGIYNPNPPQVYNDQSNAFLTLVPGGLNRQGMYETTGAIFALVPGGSDTLVSAGRQQIFETTGAQVVPATSTSTTFKYSDRASVTLAPLPGGHEAIATADHSASVVDPVPGSSERMRWANVSQATITPTPGSLDPSKLTEKTGVTVTPAAGGSATIISADRSPVTVTASAGGHDTIVAHDKSQALIDPIASSLDRAIFSPTSGATITPSVAASDRAKVQEKSATSLALAAGSSTTSGRLEVTIAPVVMATISRDTQVIHEHTGVSLSLVSGTGQDDIDALGLVPAIRYNVNRALPSLDKVAEGLPAAVLFDQIKLPSLFIVGQQPRQETSFAVRDQSVWATFDLVYVMKQEAGVDQESKMRADIELLRNQVLADYTMIGRGPYRSCDDLQITATPYERLNQYQQHFMEPPLNVVVLVLSVECLVVQAVAA